jgi:hypothetical protein
MNYQEKLQKIKLGLLPPEAVAKKKTPIKKKSDKRIKKEQKEKLHKDYKLDLWFESKMKSEKRCENCGKSLKHYSDTDFRASQHHVLEKSLYPSLRTHPLNHLVLGKWCCHSQWHQSWEKASQMKIFPKAIEIIEQLYPLLTKEEKRKLPEIIIQEINIKPWILIQG